MLQKDRHGAAGGGAGPAALPAVARADTLEAANNGVLAGQRGDQLDLGDGRGAARDLHAGGLRVPGDRLLARRRTPAPWSRRSSPTSRSPRSCTGRSASPSPSASATIIGHDGFFLRGYGDPQTAFPVMGSLRRHDRDEVDVPVLVLRRLAGDRLGDDARADQVRRLHHLRDRLRRRSSTRSRSHWVFGGGWLQANLGMQDFAGSTAVHLIGATGALAVLLQLGARRGKYGVRRAARGRSPGHSMPLFGLGVLILWLGWFGFNPGSTLGAMDGRFPEVALVTMLAAGAGVLSVDRHRVLEDGHDRHRHGRQRRDRRAGRHHGALGLRGAVGGADHRRDRRHHRPARRLRDRQEDRRPGRRADRARPVRRVGHARLRHLHVAAAGRVQRVRRGRPDLHGLVPPARHPGARRGRPCSPSCSRSPTPRSGRSRRPTACASRPRRRTPDWTSPSTACTGIRSSSSRRPSSSATAPAPAVCRRVRHLAAPPPRRCRVT